MRDWIFWPDSRCLPLTVFFFICTYFHVCMLFYDIIYFPYSYPATKIILLRSMAVFGEKLI